MNGVKAKGSPPDLEARVAALEKHGAWFRNPAWWSLAVAVILAINAIRPWEWVEGASPKPKSPPSIVKLTEAHAAAYAPNQWEAQVRVINDTSHNIKIERVRVVFGKASDGTRCDKIGNATQVLYPEAAPNQPRNAYQPLQRNEGAVFRGGPNLDRIFGGKSCPLAIAKLQIPQDRATFTALTDSGEQWRTTTTLLYEPEFRVEGAGSGGGLCILGIFPPGCAY